MPVHMEAILVAWNDLPPGGRVQYASSITDVITRRELITRMGLANISIII